MKILVINGHPDKESFCQEIFRTIVGNINSNRHELESINLNEIDFDPVLRWLSKTYGRGLFHTSLSGINPVGRSFYFCLSNLVE